MSRVLISVATLGIAVIWIRTRYTAELHNFAPGKHPEASLFLTVMQVKLTYVVAASGAAPFGIAIGAWLSWQLQSQLNQYAPAPTAGA